MFIAHYVASSCKEKRKPRPNINPHPQTVDSYPKVSASGDLLFLSVCVCVGGGGSVCVTCVKGGVVSPLSVMLYICISMDVLPSVVTECKHLC